MKLLSFIFLFQGTHLKSNIWGGFINFLSLNKVLQNLEEFRLDLNNSNEIWIEIEKGHCFYGVTRTWPATVPTALACWARNAGPRSERALRAPRSRALQPGGASGYGSPVDNRSSGLALLQLRDVNYTLLHRKIHETHGRGGLHGEAAAYRRWRGVLGRRWLFDGWLRLGVVP
jgi:hypothetical protein